MPIRSLTNGENRRNVHSRDGDISLRRTTKSASVRKTPRSENSYGALES